MTKRWERVLHTLCTRMSCCQASTPGASIPDVNIDFTEGIGRFENVIGLDIDYLEQLANGDLTGNVTNPHEITVEEPISINTLCSAPDGQLTFDTAYADNNSVQAEDSSIWILSSYPGSQIVHNSL